MRKGTHVLYFGELYTVYQKRGESVTIYKPDATCPEATMINTAATKVQPAPLEYGYIITSYTTNTGHERVEITTFKNAWPFMDIPAGELDAHREEIQINTCGRAWFIDKRTNKDEERNQETPEPAQHTEEENTMKEIKRGDFTGIYSQIDGKPLFYTGQYDYMECGGLPCVWLATDIHNNLTFSRWSQQELNKRGWTIPPRPVEISKTAMQMIHKAGAMIRWTTAEERRQANTDHKRQSPYILTAANGGQWYTTGTCADVREILKAAQAAPLPEESMPESCQKSPQEENMRRFTIYTDSSMTGIDSRGAYTTKAEARMRLEKELDEDETSRGGYIFDELRQKVTAIYNGFNLEKIPEPYRGTPNEYTTKKERAMLESIMNKYSSEPTPATPAEVLPESNQDTTTGAQEGPTTPESNTAGENTTGADKAPEEATPRPKRRMAYIVECRSPRGSWTAYSAEQSTHEAAERIKEEAENRHALTPDGAPIFYRIVQIDKGPEQIMTPQEGPTTAGTTAANETPTTAETAPQDATSDATTAETATEGPETSTPAQDTTGSDTRPPRAQEANQEPGTAAGDHTEPAADHITGPTTGNTSGAAAEAIAGRTTTPPQNPGNACENAPGRTERARAEQVHATHAKSPPRAAQKAGRNTSRGSPDRRKVTFSAWMPKIDPIPM